jgi:hypothetical protein
MSRTGGKRLLDHVFGVGCAAVILIGLFPFFIYVMGSGETDYRAFLIPRSAMEAVRFMQGMGVGILAGAAATALRLRRGR